jgi:hypothetical protein
MITKGTKYINPLFYGGKMSNIITPVQYQIKIVITIEIDPTTGSAKYNLNRDADPILIMNCFLSIMLTINQHMAKVSSMLVGNNNQKGEANNEEKNGNNGNG